MRKADNIVKLEGMLSEVDLNYGKAKRTSADRTYATDETIISGNIKVKTKETINGIEKALEVVVPFFAYELKRDGGPNPLFTNIEKIKDEFTSIAAGGVEKADLVRIDYKGGSLEMNMYVNRNTGALVTYPRINALRISKVNPNAYYPTAAFDIQFYIHSMEQDVDAEGKSTGRFLIMGAVPQFGNRVDVVPFYVDDKSIVNLLQQNWKVGDTVQALGKLNFDRKTVIVKTEVDFGEPVQEVRTTQISEPIITGGTLKPLEGDLVFSTTEIQEALARREAYIESMKERNQKETGNTGQKSTAASEFGFN